MLTSVASVVVIARVYGVVAVTVLGAGQLAIAAAKTVMKWLAVAADSYSRSRTTALSGPETYWPCWTTFASGNVGMLVSPEHPMGTSPVFVSAGSRVVCQEGDRFSSPPFGLLDQPDPIADGSGTLGDTRLLEIAGVPLGTVGSRVGVCCGEPSAEQPETSTATASSPHNANLTSVTPRSTRNAGSQAWRTGPPSTSPAWSSSPLSPRLE